METYSGEKFYPLEPIAEEVNIHDIAHALSNLCRYGGHARYFYSVAEHCCHIFDKLPEYKKEGLLHDASEAYLVDIPRPIKGHLEEYKIIEERLEIVIGAKFGLVYPYPKIVKEYDNRILVDERAVLMENGIRNGNNWMMDDLEPLGIDIKCWNPEEAEVNFLERFYALEESYA